MAGEHKRDLYATLGTLAELFPGRPFTLDGHPVGSVGEVLVAHRWIIVNQLARDTLAPDTAVEAPEEPLCDDLGKCYQNYNTLHVSRIHWRGAWTAESPPESSEIAMRCEESRRASRSTWCWTTGRRISTR